MNKMTREEINRKLEQLRETRLDDENYSSKPFSIISCYDIVECFETITLKRKCDFCKKNFLITGSYDRIHSIADYEDIVHEFRQAGLQAKFVYHCDACAEKHHLHHYEMRLKTFDEDDWHTSIPSCEPSDADFKKCISNSDYRLVLKFLAVKNAIHDVPAFFDRLYNKIFAKKEKVPYIDFFAKKNLTVSRALTLIKESVEYSGDWIYTRFIENCKILTYIYLENSPSGGLDGFSKIRVDEVLSTVLGLTIVYDKEEFRKSLFCEFSNDGIDIEDVYAMLDCCNKDTFTVREYTDFVEAVYKKYKSWE